MLSHLQQGTTTAALSLAAAGLLLLDPRAVLADGPGVGTDRHPVAYSFELAVPDDDREHVFVTYPTRCKDSGPDIGKPLWPEPTAADWLRSYQAYEVVSGGSLVRLDQGCQQGASIYALPMSRFAVESHQARSGLGGLGSHQVRDYLSVKPFDSCTGLTACEALLRGPGVQRLAHRFNPVFEAERGSSLQAVHDALAVRPRPSGGFDVVPVSVTYTHTNGATETLPYRPGGVRPKPSTTPPPPAASASVAPATSAPPTSEPATAVSAPATPSSATVAAPTREPRADERRPVTGYLVGAAALALAGGLAVVARRRPR